MGSDCDRAAEERASDSGDLFGHGELWWEDAGHARHEGDGTTMIERIIEWSARNPLLVSFVTLLVMGWGLWAVLHTPLDAIPDLSDVQVIVFTEWPGRSPDLVEDQITYPIVTSMLGAPKIKSVRGQSFLGLSFVYIIF